ncbi:MAG: ATP-binding protein [Spirochaetales bacterium]|nr:ATP-binding protein [Spirochaetales bacterium]
MYVKEFVVISGKGGTGKTSVTASLAPYFKNGVIADCDVDAPDLDILLEPKIRKREEISATRKAYFDRDKCTGCGKCRDICRFNAIRIEEGCATIPHPGQCEGCQVCLLACEEGAIRMEPSRTGELFESETAYGDMIHARLIPGEEVSGRLVAQTRQRAKERAAELNSDSILIDGPPGVACNVISSLTGADLALIVTEPTVSGFHDLKRVWETAQKIPVKTAILINKTGLGDQFLGPIEEFAASRDIPLLGQIPLSDKLRRAVNRREIPSLAHPDFPEEQFWESLVEKMRRIA